MFPFFFLWILAEWAVEGKKVWQRLGVGLPKNTGKKRIWLHASSVGEVNVIGLLFPHLQKAFPEAEIVLSAFTSAGRKRAEAIFQTRKPEMKVFYLPLDFWGFAERAVRKIAPSVLILTETELWPQLLAVAAKRGLPVFLVNGSLSVKSARRYRSVRSVFKTGFAAFSRLLVQTARDNDAFQSLGVPAEKITVVGQTKYDLLWSTDEISPPAGLANFFYWAAGSTRAGEEEKILAAHRLLAERVPNLKLLLAPRHLDRLNEIEALAQNFGFTFKRTSQNPDCKISVLLLDEMGTLLPAYAGAQVAFVGGTLAPFGGHNLLEPLSVGTPVVFGPSVGSVQEAAGILAQTEIARQVSGPEELAVSIEFFLEKKLGHNQVQKLAREAFANLGGVSEKTAAIIYRNSGKI